jgi:cysteine desulfurase
MQAIQAPKEKSESTVRMSLSETTTEEEIAYCLAVLKEVLPLLRRYTRR